MLYKQSPFGSFDVTLAPNQNKVKINAKLFWEFADEYTDREISAYKLAAERNILRVWNGVRGFTATRGSNAGLRVVPALTIEEVDSKDKSHFSFAVRKGHGGAGLIPSESKVLLYEYDAWTKQELINSTNQVIKQVGQSAATNANSLAIGATRRMERAIDRLNVRQVNLTRTSKTTQAWEVSTASKGALGLFVQALAAWPTGLPRPAVQISTTSGAVGKAAAQAAAVNQYIQSLNPPLAQTFRIDAVKTKAKAKFNPFAAHATTGAARLSSEDELALLQSDRMSNEYCVVAHEFGHCLGLPDEYADTSPAADVKWRELLVSAGVNVADRREDGSMADTPAIMHSGVVVHKRHMVTIWQALTSIGGVWAIE
jgi:hypothetical protein